MSAHTSANGPDAATQAVLDAAHPTAAPAAAPSTSGPVMTYLKNVKDRVLCGLGNVLWGTPAELAKGVVDLSSPEPWAKSALAPFGRMITSTVVRPFTAVKELVHHDGHWWFSPGKAWEELSTMVTVPFHELTDVGGRTVDAVERATHRFCFGVGELLRSPGGQPLGYQPVPSVGGYCLPSTQGVPAIWR